MNALSQVNSVFQREVPNFVPSQSRTSSLNLPARRYVRVSQSSSQWASALEDRFNELTALPQGWDGYAGIPVSFTCAQFTACLLEQIFVEGVPAPQMVPGGDGTIQFEWHRNQYDVEIDVLAPYDVAAVRRNHRTGRVEELELQADFTVLREWIAELRSTAASVI